MKRLMPRSLQGRLLAMTAIVMTLTLLGRFAANGYDRRLSAELSLLANAVDADGRVDEARLRRNPSHFEGWPDWQWQIRTSNRTISSAGYRELGWPPRPPKVGPYGAQSRTIQTKRGPVELVAAQPLGAHWQPGAFAAPSFDMLMLLVIVVGIASLVQIRLGLRPLRRLRGELAAIREGRTERLSEDQVSEILPLAREFNALAAANEAALAAARLSAANLAHALKTPVATLALDLRDNPAATAQVERIQATIRHHLTRARMQTGLRRPSTALLPAVSGVVDAVVRLHGERRLTIESELPMDLRLAVDAHDLDELLGNLIDNAARYAASCVVVRALHETGDPRWVRLTITDDGPGMSVEERQRIGQPGLRLDESGAGYGFGLAIVRELTALYGGSISLSGADGGGLTVEVNLPAAHSI
jgi:signal transduction histidine kinase